MHSTIKGLVSAACLSFATMAMLVPASARQWNPDSRGSALDYTQILHAKTGGEVVVVWWVVPEAFPSDSNTQVLKDVLGRYVVMGVANGRPTPNGAMGFSPILDLKITDQSGRQLSALPANVTPPELLQAMGAVQGIARQSLGAIGQGMRFFTFDGSTIHSCAPGKLSVPFGGETYTFDTPIPGCAK
jgi:hypothetical protein